MVGAVDLATGIEQILQGGLSNRMVHMEGTRKEQDLGRRMSAHRLAIATSIPVMWYSNCKTDVSTAKQRQSQNSSKRPIVICKGRSESKVSGRRTSLTKQINAHFGI